MYAFYFFTFYACIDRCAYRRLVCLCVLVLLLCRSTRKERTKNGALDLSNAGAELKFKIDPASGAIPARQFFRVSHRIFPNNR